MYIPSASNSPPKEERFVRRESAPRRKVRCFQQRYLSSSRKYEKRGGKEGVCCSSIESADVMRSSADDPFFRFFNSLSLTVSKQNKNFFDEKRKKDRSFLCLHTDVFLEKNHCRNTYIRRRVLIFDFLYTVFSTRWCLLSLRLMSRQF